MILLKHYCFIQNYFMKFEMQKVYNDFTAKIYIKIKRTLAIKKQK